MYFVTVCAKNKKNLFGSFAVGRGLAPAENPKDTTICGVFFLCYKIFQATISCVCIKSVNITKMDKM